MRLSCFEPVVGLRLHLPVPFTCCRHQARHPRLPVAKERFPLVAPVHDITQHARILDAQLPSPRIMVKVTTPCISHNITDRKSTRLNSSHLGISYAVFCLKK